MTLVSKERSAMEGIIDHLSSMESPNPLRKKPALLDFLSHDASIFLERYSSEITANELRSFKTLRTNNYEVEWQLNRLWTRWNPTPDEVRSRLVTVIKNRWRAYLEVVKRGGEYFSEDTMRESEPYLHHEMVGKFQNPTGRAMSRPGERWSETLMRRCEEAMLACHPCDGRFRH